MTIEFRQSTPCPNCGYDIPLETPFSQWIRERKDYDSKIGFVLMDKDLIVHRYMTNNDRTIPYIMCVEVKTKNREMDATQRDTFWTFSQLIRNRRITPTSKIPMQSNPHTLKIYSSFNLRYFHIRSFGGHVLRLSETTPDDSKTILWDEKKIDLDTLMKLLKFELNPDTLGPIDNRLHHKKENQPGLF